MRACISNAVIPMQMAIFTNNRTTVDNIYGAQNETYNDGKDVKWWNALSAKELRV